MKKIDTTLRIVIALLTICLFVTSIAQAEEKTTSETQGAATISSQKPPFLEVKYAAICGNVVARRSWLRPV